MDYRYSDQQKAAAAVITAQEAAKEAQRRSHAFTIADFGNGTGLFFGSSRVDTCYKDGDILYKTWRNLCKNPSFESAGNPVEVYRNLFANPKFEAAGTQQTLLTNMLTNPSFETASGSTVEVRRNHLSNPGVRADSLWVGYGGTTAPYSNAAGSYSYANVLGTHPLGLTRALQQEITTDGLGVGTYVEGSCRYSGSSSDIPVVVGEVWTASMYVYSTVEVSVRMRLRFNNSGGDFLGTPVSVPANTWTRVSHTATVPSGSTSMGATIKGSTGTVDSGTIIQYTGALAEKSYTLNHWFDGAYSPDSDMTAAWTGAANASAPVLNAPVLSQVATGGNRVVFQSSKWAASGSKSVRIISATPGALGARLYVNGSANIPPGVYTISATLRTEVDSANLGTIGYRPFLWSDAQGAPGVTTPTTLWNGVKGLYRYVWTFTVPDDGTAYGIYLGAGYEAGSDVQWDDAVLVTGSHDPGYFDGATPPKVRRNLVPYADHNEYSRSKWPCYVIGGTGGANTRATVTDVGPYGSAMEVARCTVTTAYAGATSSLRWDNQVNAGNGFKTTAGVTYTFSCWVRSSVATTGNVFLESLEHDSSNNYLQLSTTVSRSNLPLQANTWTRLYITFTTLNPKVVNSGVRVSAPGLGNIAGAVFDTVMPMCEEGAVVGEPFSGSTSPDPDNYAAAWEGTPNGSPSYLYDRDFTAAWSGAAHQSPSSLRGISVTYAATGTPSLNKTYRTTTNEGHGAKALNVGPTNGIRITTGTFPVVSGETYTVLFRVWGSGARTDGILELDTNYSKKVTFNISTEPTWVRGTVTMGNTGNSNRQFVVSGAPVGYWIVVDRFLIIKGNYLGDYFDGDASPDPDMTASWAGAVDGTESILSAIPVTGHAGTNRFAIQSDSWTARGEGKSCRILPYQDSTDAFVELNDLPSSDWSAYAGKTITARAVAHWDETLPNANRPNFRVIATWGANSYTVINPISTVEASAAPGTYVVKSVYELPSDLIRVDFFRFMSKQQRPTGIDVWVDDVTITEGNYTGEYWDGDKPPTLRKNLCSDPTTLGGTWSSAGSYSTQALVEVDDLPGFTQAMARLVTGSTANWQRPRTPYIDVTAGRTYTFSGWVKKSVDNGFIELAVSYNNGVAGPPEFKFTSVAGEWKRVSATVTIPSGVTQVQLHLGMRSVVDSGDYVYATGALVEEGSTLGKFFTGDHYKAYWEGTPGASPSVRYDARYTIPSWEGDPHASVSRMWGANVDRGEPDIVPFTTPESAISALENSDGTVFVSGPGVVSNRDGTITLDDNYVTVLPDGGIEF